MIIEQALGEARAALEATSESARLDAEVLLGFVLGRTRASLIAAPADFISDEHYGLFQALAARRIQGVPVAYLTGRREFWSLDLRVTPDVLIPRPETELLVERALQLLPQSEERSVLDLGTGSGAIALSIATDRPRSHITGSDVSASALNVARANAKRLDLKHIEWQLSSWFDALGGRRFDLIACNPPYVAAADAHLAALHAEPRLALTPGNTGLESYQAIIPAAAAHLTPRGWLLFEHGATQAAAITNMLEHQGFHNVTSHPDYAGRPRVTLASLHPSTQGLS